MRATLLPYSIILTKVRTRATVSIMAKGSIVALILLLMCFLFFTIHGISLFMPL